MKKIILLIFTFSVLFIFLTFLNYELEVIGTKVKKIDYQNQKLENELNFLKSEWEFVNSPENMSLLTNTHLGYKPAQLITLHDFINIILGQGKNSE
ncbi:MAG: hypothetical protein CMP36_03560 [Rickettsiales bacterium]|nr:hypothetical protein [Rickettsiales bacterium]OUV78997.1 MAG: hypothetical protein CBC91_04330 [Rickettsiales bacterium TMED131]|tara:strand:- start:433 stop:720 length:288 start_codon:yes stop_codon:yes gene_type:complete